MLKGCEPATLAVRPSLIHSTVVSRTHDYYSLAASWGGKQLGIYSGAVESVV